MKTWALLTATTAIAVGSAVQWWLWRYLCELVSLQEGLYGCFWNGQLAEDELKKGIP